MRVYIYVLLSAILGLKPFAPIEQSLEETLMSSVPGLESVSIRIDASRLAFLFLGYCRRVNVELRGVFAGPLRIAVFRIDSRGFRFRPFSTFVRNRPRVRGARLTRWNLRIYDDDLESFLDAKGPILRGTCIQINNDGVTVRRHSTLASLLKLKEPVSLFGRLVLNEKRAVMLELDHLKTFGVEAASPFLKSVLKVINPILIPDDINRMLRKTPSEFFENIDLSIGFEDICMEKGYVFVCGRMLTTKRSPDKVKNSKKKKSLEKKNGVKKIEIEEVKD
ncbi:MAG TPA: hypothetical protein PLN69_10480 [bacterium]|nr:hypothetical protein [bacterium]